MILAFLSIKTSAVTVLINGLNYVLDEENKEAKLTYRTGVSYSGDVVIPDKITYNNKEYLVTVIGFHSFFNCSQLKTVTIGDNVKEIEKQAFASSSSLSTIILGKNVLSMGDMAFLYCSSLFSIVITKNVKEIGKWAFSGCASLQNVYCMSKVIPTTGLDCFDTPNNKTLYVPESSLTTYKSSEPWKNFGQIRTIKDNYKLTYYLDEELYKECFNEFASIITPEEEPTPKEGYTFSGWSEIPKTMPANDVTITGTFVVNKYKITYMVDGKVYKVEEYDYGKEITPPSRPEGEYDSFEWENLPSTMPANNVVVNVKYTLLPNNEPGQKGGHRMVLNLKNGNNIFINLNDKPQISFSGSQFVIKTSTNTFEYVRSDIEDFHFEQIETSVESIEYSGEGDVTIYEMNGRMVAKLRNESINSAKMYLNEFKSGIYIIKIGNQKSIKYLKK